MFAIRLHESVIPEPDPQWWGEIAIGDFYSSFAGTPFGISFEEMAGHWRDQLYALIGGEPAVILRYDPYLAWIVYREGANCYVRKHLSFDDFQEIRPRETVSEDGDAISEWTTTMSAIQAFLLYESAAPPSHRDGPDS